ncbi:unnamed protein product [Dovyalis caffra]|uniref:Uncharacterized protein n=1 Tax=Dovyalis caffra TaxID=77055 RepID=A0AAV1SBM0_9ROSI|nr:unnamed protein product [Dovyalis caffra]
MDGIPGARSWLTSLILRGSSALKNARFDEAAKLFKSARDARFQLYGDDISLEDMLLHHVHGVSLLSEIPFQGGDDPLAFVPKEADYYLAEDISYSSYSKLYSEGTITQEDYANQMEAAQKELKIAWSILDKESDCLIEKGNTLSALGEVALRREEANPERYYIQASSFFESLDDDFHKQRIADMDKIKAIEYGEKALSSYQTRLKQLISETQSSSKPAETQTASDLDSSSPTETDPSIPQKKSERSRLIEKISKLQFKLDDLKAGSSTSLNLERTSLAPAGQRDGKEKLSQLIQLKRQQLPVFKKMEISVEIYDKHHKRVRYLELNLWEDLELDLSVDPYMYFFDPSDLFAEESVFSRILVLETLQSTNCFFLQILTISKTLLVLSLRDAYYLEISWTNCIGVVFQVDMCLKVLPTFVNLKVLTLLVHAKEESFVGYSHQHLKEVEITGFRGYPNDMELEGYSSRMILH